MNWKPKILRYESGALVDTFDEKTEVKIRAIAPKAWTIEDNTRATLSRDNGRSEPPVRIGLPIATKLEPMEPWYS